jgi:adenylosuccinate synthase
VLIPDSWIYLNAGAIIDLELLGREVDDVSRALGVPAKSIWDRMTVHPHATVITDEARSIEKYGATQHLGSTQKGVGAALASKIMRYPDAVFNEHKYPGPATEEIDLDGHTVLIEIPQGTGLSLNSSGFYPKVTSRECWVGQGMVDAGLHPSKLGVVSMVVRTMPIRVGHIYGDNNEIVGNSGPFYSDSRELTWDEVGVEPERTTVTQRVRRIATWSRKQYKHALKLNRPDNVFLTFTNYLTRAELKDLVITMREDEINARLRVNHYFSWGPRTDQISAIYLDAHANCKDA